MIQELNTTLNGWRHKMQVFTQYINAVLHTYEGYNGKIAIEELQKSIVEDSPVYESDPSECTIEFEYDSSFPMNLQVDKLYAIFTEVKFMTWINDDREGEVDYEVKQLKIRELPIEWLEDFEKETQHKLNEGDEE